MRKFLTLPSGATCSVRNFSTYDFLESGGDIPALFQGKKPKSEKQKKELEEALQKDPQAIAFGIKSAKLSLTKCCGPISYPDGSKIRIVAKEFHECLTGEISIEEFDDEDAKVIIAAVSEISKMGKEVGQSVQKFPSGEQSASSGNSQPS